MMFVCDKLVVPWIGGHCNGHADSEREHQFCCVT